VPVPTYTDLFNEGYDDLVAKLQTVPSLQVVNDPRNIVPPCVFVNIDSIEGFNYNIAKLTFTLIRTDRRNPSPNGVIHT
jgi:hypothetical protein